MKLHTSTARCLFCFLMLSGISCGGGGGSDSAGSGGDDSFAASPSPAPTPILTSCADNTASCDQADSELNEAAEHGIGTSSSDIGNVDGAGLGNGSTAPGLNQGSALRECTIIICSSNVNVGDTSVTNTTTTTTTQPADKWAGVVSVEVRR